MHTPSPSSRPGYIALLSILMVSAIAASAILILFSTSITSVQNVGYTEEGLLALANATNCMERALQSVNNRSEIGNGSTYDTAGGIDTGTCTVVSIVDSGAGETCDNNETCIVQTEGAITRNTGTVTRRLEVLLTLPQDSPPRVTSWKEVLSF